MYAATDVGTRATSSPMTSQQSYRDDNRSPSSLSDGGSEASTALTTVSSSMSASSTNAGFAPTVRQPRKPRDKRLVFFMPELRATNYPEWRYRYKLHHQRFQRARKRQGRNL